MNLKVNRERCMGGLGRQKGPEEMGGVMTDGPTCQLSG